VIGSVGDMIALGDESWFKLVAREIVPVPANIARRCGFRPARRSTGSAASVTPTTGPSST